MLKSPPSVATHVDNMRTTGIYSGHNITNLPSVNGAMLIVEVSPGQLVRQTFVDRITLQTRERILQMSTGVWSAWAFPHRHSLRVARITIQSFTTQVIPAGGSVPDVTGQAINTTNLLAAFANCSGNSQTMFANIEGSRIMVWNRGVTANNTTVQVVCFYSA